MMPAMSLPAIRRHAALLKRWAFPAQQNYQQKLLLKQGVTVLDGCANASEGLLR